MKQKLWIGAAVIIALMAALAACSIDGPNAGPDGAPPANLPDGNTEQGNPPADNPAATPEAATGDNANADGGGPNQEPMPTLSPDQEAAINEFARVTVGILYLQDNQPGSISKEQASTLLATYQDIQTILETARKAQGDFPGPNGGPGGNGQPPADFTPPAGGPGGGPGGNRGPGPDEWQGVRGGMDGFRILVEQDLGKLQQYLTSIRGALTAEQLTTIDTLTEDDLAATLEKHEIGAFVGGNRQPPAGGTPDAPPAMQGTPSPDDMATFQAGGGPAGVRPINNPVITEVIAVLTAITGS